MSRGSGRAGRRRAAPGCTTSEQCLKALTWVAVASGVIRAVGAAIVGLQWEQEEEGVSACANLDAAASRKGAPAAGRPGVQCQVHRNASPLARHASHRVRVCSSIVLPVRIALPIALVVARRVAVAAAAVAAAIAAAVAAVPLRPCLVHRIRRRQRSVMLLLLAPLHLLVLLLLLLAVLNRRRRRSPRCCVRRSRLLPCSCCAHRFSPSPHAVLRGWRRWLCCWRRVHFRGGCTIASRCCCACVRLHRRLCRWRWACRFHWRLAFWRLLLHRCSFILPNRIDCCCTGVCRVLSLLLRRRGGSGGSRRS